MKTDILAGHTNPITGLHVSSNIIITSSLDCSLIIWEKNSLNQWE